MHPDRHPVDPVNGPVLYRRSTGQPRHDITIGDTELNPAPPPRQPIRVVGTPRPIPEQRVVPRSGPGRATGVAYTTSALWHLFRVVLPRYLLATLLMGGIAWFWTKALWATILIGALPLPIFGWYLMLVISQARAYRQGHAAPPPGYLGNL